MHYKKGLLMLILTERLPHSKITVPHRLVSIQEEKAATTNMFIM